MVYYMGILQLCIIMIPGSECLITDILSKDLPHFAEALGQNF